MVQEIVVDEEFRFLLPLLDKETFALLEENILENGIRDPIVLWGDVVGGGHNRLEIARKHGLPFATVSKEFDSRDAAMIWIISTQVSRRNLTPIQLSYFRGLHYAADKRIVTNAEGKNCFGEAILQAADGFLSKARRLAGMGGTAELAAATRSHIAILDGLCRRL